MYLLQLITSGLLDKVAKLEGYDSGAKGQQQKLEGGRYRYTIGETGESAYIHPASNLFQNPPQYICFHELIRTKKDRLYMCGVTEVMPEWLCTVGKTMCAYSPPLEIPPTKYDEEEDRVVCHVKVSFGSSRWPLITQKIDYPVDNMFGYRVFARALLEGKVVNKMKWLLPHLNTSPLLLTKEFPNVKAMTLIQALAKQRVRSKKALKQAWRKNTQYLLAEVSVWVNASAQEKLQRSWPYL